MYRVSIVYLSCIYRVSIVTISGIMAAKVVKKMRLCKFFITFFASVRKKLYLCGCKGFENKVTWLKK